MQTTAGNTDPKTFYVQAGANEVWWFRGGTVDVRLTAAQTDGRAGMWITAARRGGAPPLHVHHREEEQFLVLDGQASFVIGEQRLDARAGDLVFLPREIPHTFIVTSPSARLLGTVTPGGMEAFFTELGAPVRPGAPAEPPPTIEAMAATARRYGVDDPRPTTDARLTDAAGVAEQLASRPGSLQPSLSNQSPTRPRRPLVGGP